VIVRSLAAESVTVSRAGHAVSPSATPRSAIAAADGASSSRIVAVVDAVPASLRPTTRRRSPARAARALVKNTDEEGSVLVSEGGLFLLALDTTNAEASSEVAATRCRQVLAHVVG
jgi:hypothetical protein